MADFPESINSNKRILVSRTTPVALVVGSAGFLGSYLVDELLSRGIQIIGVDDLSTGHKKNIDEAIKNKNFHFLNQPPSHLLSLELPRLDYAFWVTGRAEGLDSFLSLCAKNSTKIVLVSSIELYERNIHHSLVSLKHSEVDLAKFAKEKNLNARVIRLAPLYGPRMHFKGADPVSRLIQASILGELQSEQTSLDFSSRSLFVTDAVNLIIKSVLSGGTAGKIFDGVLPNPIQVSEVKQVLLDPLWYEKRGFHPTELPPWSTPNLKRSLKELSWRPRVSLIEGLKRTVSYFKDNNVPVSHLSVKELDREMGEWRSDSPRSPFEHLKQDAILGGSSSGASGEATLESSEEKDSGQGSTTAWNRVTEDSSKKHTFGRFILVREGIKRRGVMFLCIALIIYALIFPLLSISIGSLFIRNHLKAAALDIEVGKFDEASGEVGAAQSSLNQLKGLIGSLILLKRLNIATTQLNNFEDMVSVLGRGVDGASHATAGVKDLFAVTQIISGESNDDPQPLYFNASTELTTASGEISQVQASLNNPDFINSLPGFFQGKAKDFSTKLDFYAGLVNQAQTASNLLPEITAVGDKRSYLLLLEDNLTQRGSGGLIKNYAILNFDHGRIVSSKVDLVSNLDGQLKDQIEPPAEVKSDLGESNYLLKDSNFEPDFPTSAKLAEFFLNKEAGERVNGVFELDLYSVGKLLSAVGGVDLTDYGEHIDESNLYAKVIAHQSDPKYLSTLEQNLLNKIFFLSEQNWAGIASALADSLSSKHTALYFDDPTIFSFSSSQNWSGVLPRAPKVQDGVMEDFLSLVDSNMSEQDGDYFLDKKMSLQSNINAEGSVTHHLEYSLNNKGDSPYKDRVRIYLPLGAKLNKALWGDSEITSTASTFSDYSRTGYSLLINLNPKEIKKLTLEYQLADNFKGGDYNLNIFKQVGESSIPLSWDLNFTDFKLTSLSGQPATTGSQVVHIDTDLNQDRILSVGLSK